MKNYLAYYLQLSLLQIITTLQLFTDNLDQVQEKQVLEPPVDRGLDGRVKGSSGSDDEPDE